MDPLPMRGWPARAGLPRASGDGPYRLLLRAGAGAAAPRERGWTLDPRDPAVEVPGCPARAGMDPFCFIDNFLLWWLPRASGDGPWPEKP